MLVVSRKKGEQIFVGEGASQIVISIADIKGNTVRVGVQAPKNVNIRRSELSPKSESSPQA